MQLTAPILYSTKMVLFPFKAPSSPAKTQSRADRVMGAFDALMPVAVPSCPYNVPFTHTDRGADNRKELTTTCKLCLALPAPTPDAPPQVEWTALPAHHTDGGCHTMPTMATCLLPTWSDAARRPIEGGGEVAQENTHLYTSRPAQFLVKMIGPLSAKCSAVLDLGQHRVRADGADVRAARLPSPTQYGVYGVSATSNRKCGRSTRCYAGQRQSENKCSRAILDAITLAIRAT